MTIDIRITRFQRRGNFYHGKGVVIHGALGSRQRGGDEHSVVLARRGYRVKLFLQGDHDDDEHVGINGIRFGVPLDKSPGELHTARPGPEIWEKIVASSSLPREQEDITKPAPEPKPFVPIDACIEGTFDPERLDKRYGWCVGTFEDLPDWMGDDVEVSLARAPYNDGGYIVMPEASLRKVPPFLRVNGVWMLVSPIGYKPGHYLLGAMPEDIAEARDYGGEELPNDETLPIRARQQLRPLFRKIVPNFGYVRISDEIANDYRAWRAAIPVITGCMMGFGQTHRQWIHYQHRAKSTAEASSRKFARSMGRFNKRPAAYKDYAFDAWLEEANDKYAKKWQYEGRIAHEASHLAKSSADNVHKTLVAKRQEYDAAVAVIEPLEAKYEAIIREMYPA